MLKPYSELRKVDISRYCMEREGIKYLNWAKCIDILREYGAEEVYFEPIPNRKTGGTFIILILNLKIRAELEIVATKLASEL